MDFTTESLVYFFTEQIPLGDDFADASSSSFKGFAVGTRFEQIPFWQDALFTWSICILSFILNLIVLLFYGNERKSSGVYLLVLAVVDIVAPILLLLPRFALEFVTDPAARDVIVTGRVYLASGVTTVYLYGQLFLATDRALAILFPFEYQSKVKATRLPKVLVVGLSLLISIGATSCNLLFGFDSTAFVVMTTLQTIVRVLQIVASGTVYIVIVVNIVRNQRRMAQWGNTSTDTKQ